MKVMGWIFFVLAVLAIPVFTIVGATDVTEDSIEFMAIFGVILFFVLGSIGHLFIMKKSEEDKATKVLYWLTFPSFIILFVLIWVGSKIFKFITKGSSKSSSSSRGCSGYVVIEDGNKRLLRFVGQKQDISPDSPFYMNYYNSFVDDNGYYWRSYDGNESFVKESLEQRERGY